jgi:hypothetical protein
MDFVETVRDISMWKYISGMPLYRVQAVGQ